MSQASPQTMRAVVFKAPGHIVVEDRPVPTLQSDDDVIIKVSRSALCGSDLHYYRRHGQARYPNFITGHEVIGHISAKGPAITSFNIGDKVVLPFHTACADCFYCKRGGSSRCAKSQHFGDGLPGCIDGGHAEYIRVPQAITTVVHAPASIDESVLVLMADIFPTGYYCASRFLKDLPKIDLEDLTVALVGCGPVGICALTAAIYLTGGRGRIFAIDSVTERLEEARRIGAIPINLNENPVEKIKQETAGRGADVVLEVVGQPDALSLAVDLVRPWGKISIIGSHGQPLHLSGATLHGKNVTMAFGCCPVRSLFEEALVVLEATQDKVKPLCGTTMSLEEAPEAFKLFDQRKVHKIVFLPGEKRGD